MSPQQSEPVSLAQVIAWTESKDHRTALRFEASIWEKLSERQTHSQRVILALIAAANQCSQGTARMIYATSWGLYQIMGFNLYGPELSLSMSIGDYLNNEVAQDDAFVRLIATMGLQATTPDELAAQPLARHHFGLRWNGSATYAEPLVESLRHFNLIVKE